MGGIPIKVAYTGAGKPTVLYLFKPTCPWCKRNIENINSLFRAEGARYRFIGISLSAAGLAPYVAKEQMKFEIVSGLSSQSLAAYHFIATPTTLVVSPDGHVLADWAGAYEGGIQTAVERFFSVKLPGLVGIQNSAE